MVVEFKRTPVTYGQEKGVYIDVGNNEKNKATLVAEVTIYTNKTELGYVGCFQDGKICGLMVKKCTGGRAVGRGLYDATCAFKKGQRPNVQINDNSCIPFVNEIIRKYN